MMADTEFWCNENDVRLPDRKCRELGCRVPFDEVVKGNHLVHIDSKFGSIWG